MPATALEISALDRDGLPLKVTIKSCSGGDGLKTLRRWLGDVNDVVLLANGRDKPLVLVSWEAWGRVARTVVRGDFSPDEPRERGPGYDHSPLARAL